MFTGIVQATGTVVEFDLSPGGAVMSVSSPVLAGVQTGGSVAVNGCCLTVVSLASDVARFDLHNETLERSTHRARAVGDTVNLERSLKVGDELGGHFVTGHVEAVGRVADIVPDGDGRRLEIEAPEDFVDLCVPKGSVTVDGVSLTITTITGNRFGIAVIPHTIAVTNIKNFKPGTEVNLEADPVAKHVQRILAATANKQERTDHGVHLS